MLMNFLDYEDQQQEILENPDEPMGYHVPIMADEVVALLRPAPGLIFLDGTAGGGGHTERFLKAGATVVALDQDADAIAHCAERFSDMGQRLKLVRTNFSKAGEALDGLGIDKVAGALLDIGVSSHQLDTAERGFALMKDGPLDMRMDQSAPLSAADLVNTADVLGADAHLFRVWRGAHARARSRRTSPRCGRAGRCRRPLTSRRR